MIYVLYEGASKLIHSFTEELYKKYPVSARFYLSPHMKDEELQCLALTPLLTDGWLVFSPKKFKLEIIKKIEKLNKNNLVLIQVDTINDLEKVSQELDNVKFSIIENYKLSRIEVINWIYENLNSTRDVAEFLYKQHRGRLRDIVESVQMLECLPNVQIKDVRAFAQKTETTNINDITQYILGISRRGITLEHVIKVVYRFRFGISWLLETVENALEDYLLVFTYLDSGMFTMENYMQVFETISDKRLSSLTTYHLQKIIESYGKVSGEYIYYVLQLIKRIKRNKFSSYKFITLLKLN